MNENQLMFFNEHTDIYWHGTFIGVAVFLGCLLFWTGLNRIRSGAAQPMKYILLFGFPLAVVLSRLEYCWFRQDEFQGGLPDILDVSKGGFGVIGAMAGIALVIAAVGAKNKRYSTAELFDAAAPAAAIALCIGRMASAFSGEERGFELYMDFFQNAMFTVYSPEEDKVFVSVYQYESIAAGIMFFVAVWMINQVYRNGKYLPGVVAVRFVMGFTLSQMLFESWRSDSLFLVYLGFVRFNQAFCAIVLAVLLVFVCKKYADTMGYKHSQIALWATMLAGIALAFVCEFFMTGGNHLQNYCGMAAGLIAVYVVALMMILRGFKISRITQFD